MTVPAPLAKPTRPVLRWHGGKWKLAPWIIGHFPRHRIYVEPFGGAGSVLLRKDRTYAEVYNDLDDVVINLFRVLRDDAKAARLVQQLRLTPFARVEFNEALHDPEDDVERARHLVVRAFMGFGSNAHSSSPVAEKTAFKTHTRAKDEYRSTGFRANSSRSGNVYTHALDAAVDVLVTGKPVSKGGVVSTLYVSDAKVVTKSKPKPRRSAPKAEPRGRRS